MIPVRAIDDGRAPALGFLVAQNVDLLESGLRMTTTDLVIGDDLVIDVLAHDVEGRPVLVLVEDGTGEPLFQRAATAVLEFRRAARLFHALNPERGFDVHDTPRLLLVARRLAERTEALLALLKIPSLKTFECTVVDSATGFQLVVTSRSATPVRAFSASRKDVDDAPPSLSAASLRAGFTADKAQKKPGKPRGKVTRTLFDEMKERLLRLSPDVLEEQDGDVVSFRIGDNLLARSRAPKTRCWCRPAPSRGAWKVKKASPRPWTPCSGISSISRPRAGAWRAWKLAEPRSMRWNTRRSRS
jgi:hypothetical protein